MKQRFDLFLIFALVAACGITYALLIAKVQTWTIWQPLEAYFTG